MNTFHWPQIQRSSWLLAGFIFLSLFLHSAAFLLFQAASPLRPPAPRPAQPVQYLTPYGADGRISPENVALLQWIAAEDPALIAHTPAVLPPDLLNVPYHPSYHTMRTAPLGVPDENAGPSFPSARDPMSLILGNSTAASPAIPPVAPQPTRLTFSGPIAGRAPATAFSPNTKSRKPVEPTRIFLGINAGGDVRFVFPQGPSSSNQALDDEALAFVRGLRFAPSAGAPPAWGFAVFQWGDDATTNEP